MISLGCRACLLLTLALACVANAQTTITASVITRNPVPNDCSVQPPAETRFLTTDRGAWLVYTRSGGKLNDQAVVEWLDPSGSVDSSSSFQQSDNAGTHYGCQYLAIYGATAGAKPGDWRVRMRWNGAEVLNLGFTIAVPAASALVLATDSLLPEGPVGGSYRTVLSVSGGTQPYRFSVTGGALPPGLALSNDGVVSGTPAKAGSHVFTVTIQDSAGNSLQRTLALGISQPALRIGVGSLQFTAAPGSAPQPQMVPLSSNGSALGFTAAATTISGGNWLSVSPANGTTPATLQVSVNAGSLAPGAYQGQINLHASGAATVDQSFTVSLAVLSTDSAPVSTLVNTVAGTDWTFTGDGGPGVSAPMGKSFGIAADSQGNLYSADSENNLVLRVSPDGVVTVAAGNGLAGFSGDGGPATSASLSNPRAVAVDAAGNIYVTDNGNNRVRAIGTDGIIRTIAGSSRTGYAGDGGPALNALINKPDAIAIDGAANVYFHDRNNWVIRRIATDGTISTYAGNGQSGVSGDGGQATQAAIDVSVGMAFDAAGNLYFCENSNHVRKVAADGTISRFAGTGDYTSTGDGGPAVQATFRYAYGLAVDAAGNVYVGDFNAPSIRRISPDGIITTYAGGNRGAGLGDGGPVSAADYTPVALAFDSQGNLFVSDRDDRRVFRLDPGLTVTTMVGNGQYRNAPDASPATGSFLYTPSGVTFDKAGNLLIADSGANKIRLVDPSGAMRTFAGTGAYGCCYDGLPAVNAFLQNPIGITVDSAGAVYFADRDSHRIRRVGPDGKISTYAGTGTQGYSGDGGPAGRATLSYPHGVAADDSGNLYIADQGNNVIRKVDANGTMSTYAGNGKAAYSGDNGPALQAGLNQPSDVWFGPDKRLYVVDQFNHVVRRIGPDGTISTFAGNGKQGGSGDGGPASQASLNYPSGVTGDSAGNIYITEYTGGRVRRVAPNGVISTLLGGPGSTWGFSGDGGPSTAALVRATDGSIAVGPDGVLYFADSGNQRIRAIQSSQAVSAAVSPGSLNFSSSGLIPEAQKITVGSSNFGLPFQAAPSTTSGGAWLRVDSASGTTPGSLSVTADPSGLAPGQYTGKVLISTPGANPASSTVAVTLSVTQSSGAKLGVTGGALSFSVVQGGQAANAQVGVANLGGDTLRFSVSPSTSSGGNWLSVDLGQGSAAANNPVSVTVTAAPGSLAAGVYRGTVAIASSNTADAVVNLPVTMVVSSPQSVIVLSQTGLSFVAVAQGGLPLSQSVGILNSGQGAMNWTASAVTLSGGNWLKLSAAAGTVARPLADVSFLDVSVDTSGLAPGDYFGQIRIAAPGADNSPQSISVQLSVLAPGSQLGPEVRPSGLVFTGLQGSAPGSQAVQIANLGTGSSAYVSVGKTFDGANWFVHSPVNATISPNLPGKVVVQPNFTNLDPGIRRGFITIQFEDGTLRNVSLLTVVAPPDSGAKDARGAGGCTPNSLSINLTGSPTELSAAIGQAVPLEARVVNECGPVTPDTPGTVVRLDFPNNEEDSGSLVHTTEGRWSRTFQARRSKTGQTITAYITAVQAASFKFLVQQLAVKINISGNRFVPQVSSSGVVNSASFASGGPVAPGTLVTLLGTDLADGSQVSDSAPLPTQLGGTEVRLGDRALPLLYAGPGQVNAQIPYDLPVNTQHQLLVRRGDVISLPESVTVAAAQPAIYTVRDNGQGQGKILNVQANAWADQNNPVAAGEKIVIYCTGLGATSPPVASGAAATAPSDTVQTVTVLIDRKPAPVLYSGLAVGTPGLYQINATVPSGVQAGSAVPVVVQVGGQTSPAVTMAVR